MDLPAFSDRLCITDGGQARGAAHRGDAEAEERSGRHAFALHLCQLAEKCLKGRFQVVLFPPERLPGHDDLESRCILHHAAGKVACEPTGFAGASEQDQDIAAPGINYLRIQYAIFDAAAVILVFIEILNVMCEGVQDLLHPLPGRAVNEIRRADVLPEAVAPEDIGLNLRGVQDE